mmetsp:Transcript_3773/g.6516  ORF Transcript_3773/g.6516 Transcript_3773/m.6516 type:complete len:319 (+) Transcript_3773:55-1011(+)
MSRTTSIPWDEDMPSLVDHGDSSLSVASSISKQSELLPQKLQFNNSGDSTDVSTNPSVTAAAECNPAEQDAAGSKRKKKNQTKKKRSMFSRMKAPFRGQNQKTEVKELPHQTPHTLHTTDNRGNVECYVLDARAILVEEQEKAKALRPVGLVSDGCGNVECRALKEGSARIEVMKPPVDEELVEKPSMEEQQCNTVEQLKKQICMQPSSDTAMVDGCHKETANCSFYDQVYAQLMGSPSDLNEPIASCIDEENLNLPDSKDVMDGIKREVKGGLKLLDDCVVEGLFPTREDIFTIQGLAITHSETEVEMEHSYTQAEI